MAVRSHRVASRPCGSGLGAARPVPRAGYVLEASGRSRADGIRDGFIGVRTAARFGVRRRLASCFGLPLYGMSIMAESARIIDPRSDRALVGLGLSVLAIVFALHVSGSILRGTNPGLHSAAQHPVARAARTPGWSLVWARDRLWNTIAALAAALTSGSASAASWCIPPGSSFHWCCWRRAIACRRLRVLGAVLLAIVGYSTSRSSKCDSLADNRFRLRSGSPRGGRSFADAPIAFAVALWVHLLLAMPLYLRSR